jgi:phosphate transport system substrate-binding protein
VSPLDEDAIAHKQYFFQRPLYQFIRKESVKKVEPFIAFEQNEKGLAIIKASGYYSVPK